MRALDCTVRGLRFRIRRRQHITDAKPTAGSHAGACKEYIRRSESRARIAEIIRQPYVQREIQLANLECDAFDEASGGTALPSAE